MTQDHLDPDLIAAYAEHRLAPPESSAVEAHLAACGECRGDAAATALLLAGERRRRRRLVAVPLVAAAAAVALVAVTTRLGDPIAPGLALRPGDVEQREGVAALGAYAPAAGATVARAGLRFVWQQDGPDATYRFTLADHSGLPLWQATTSDTNLTVPDSIALPAGELYLWYVDVLLSDAQKATTGIQEFTVGR